MAETPDAELAKNIIRNVVPFNAGEDVGNMYTGAENAAVKLLRTLGLIPPAAQGSMDVPRMDAQGNILFPENQMQITPGDVGMRRLQMQIQREREGRR